jgi:hypothetical protein
MLMPSAYADDLLYMRLTVTLDDDVATGIKAEMERSEESFKQVVNKLMRLGFTSPNPPPRKGSKAGSITPRRRTKRNR